MNKIDLSNVTINDKYLYNFYSNMELYFTLSDESIYDAFIHNTCNIRNILYNNKPDVYTKDDMLKPFIEIQINIPGRENNDYSYISTDDILQCQLGIGWDMRESTEIIDVIDFSYDDNEIVSIVNNYFDELEKMELER